MQRHNMVQQFVGEPDPMSEGTSAEDVGYDEVKIAIKGGHLSVVVPSGTPDDQIWNDPRVCLIDVETEDGEVFHFEVTHSGDGVML